MNVAKKISVITVTWNRVELLEQAINSLIDQGYENYEHIIIDNASTDGTVETVLWGDASGSNIGGVGTNNNYEFNIYQNGGVAIGVDTNKNVTFSSAVWIPDYIYHVGDSNSYFGYSANDNFILRTNASTQIFADATNTYLYFDGTQKLRTTSAGIFITGQL